jgi:hypothetical protein
MAVKSLRMVRQRVSKPMKEHALGYLTKEDHGVK